MKLALRLCEVMEEAIMLTSIMVYAVTAVVFQFEFMNEKPKPMTGVDVYVLR